REPPRGTRRLAAQVLGLAPGSGVVASATTRPPRRLRRGAAPLRGAPVWGAPPPRNELAQGTRRLPASLFGLDPVRVLWPTPQHAPHGRLGKRPSPLRGAPSACPGSGPVERRL